MPLTETGYVITPLATRRAQTEEVFRQSIGEGIRTTPSSNFGKVIGIISEDLVQQDESGQATYNASNIDNASGVGLDKTAYDVAGIRRNSATSTAGIVYSIGNVGQTVPAAGQFRSVNNDIFTVNTATILIGTGQQSISTLTSTGAVATATFGSAHGLAVNDVVRISGADQTQYNGWHRVVTVPSTTAITYTVITGLSSPATGTIAGTQATPINVTAQQTGPVQASANTITVVQSTIPALTEINNIDDLTLGTNLESDAQLRTRAIENRRGRGRATNAAIRSAIEDIDNVVGATVTGNRTDVIDADGRPPHSFEATVTGGDNTAIATAIFNTGAEGIATHGDITVNITDSSGQIVPISFSRPTNIDIWLEIDLTVNSTEFPSGGADQVRTLIVAAGNALDNGDDVIVYPTLLSWFASVAGITDVAVRIAGVPDGDPDPSPTLDDNIIISSTEKASFDASRITINIL